MNASKTSKKQLISSKAREAKEVQIRCIDCGRHIIDILKFKEQEFNRVTIKCVCGTEFPTKFDQRIKIQAANDFEIEDIQYETLTAPLVCPRRGETNVRIKKKN